MHMNAKEELQSIAPQHVSEVTREALLSAIASETRRICAQNTHSMGEWLEGEVPEATSIDAANYMVPGIR